MDAAAWGLIGTLVGALASIGTSWITSKSSNQIQREKLTYERAERAKDFQRETLLQLQEAIHENLRFTARANFEDYKNSRHTGTWGRTHLSDDVNDGLLNSRRRVSILVERVADDSLRKDIKSLMEIAAEGAFSKSEDEAEHNQMALSKQMTHTLPRIGAVLRSNY